MAKTVINAYVIKVEFDNLADAWDFCDRNGLKRCERFKEKEPHPYMKGPLEWTERLQFWNNVETGKIRYSEKAKEYYNNWLASMWEGENNITKMDQSLK